MKVKELIQILQSVDGELPVATCANNQEYFSDPEADGVSHGEMVVSLAHHYAGKHIIIGNQYNKDLNSPNWYIISDIYGETEDDLSEDALDDDDDQFNLMR